VLAASSKGLHCKTREFLQPRKHNPQMTQIFADVMSAICAHLRHLRKNALVYPHSLEQMASRRIGKIFA
jgi:hypothetical protein